MIKNFCNSFSELLLHLFPHSYQFLRNLGRNGDYYIVYLAEDAGMSDEEKTQVVLEAAQKEFGDRFDSQETWNVDRLGKNTIEVVNGKRRSARSMKADWAPEYNDMKDSDVPRWYRDKFMQEIQPYWIQDGSNELLRGSYEIYLVTPPQHE